MVFNLSTVILLNYLLFMRSLLGFDSSSTTKLLAIYVKLSLSHPLTCYSIHALIENHIVSVFIINALSYDRSNHVLPCRPSGVTLDIKKSSFKKLSKWLQSKASNGLVILRSSPHRLFIVKDLHILFATLNSF